MQDEAPLRHASTYTERKRRVSVVATNSTPSSPRGSSRRSHASTSMTGSVSTTHTHTPGRDGSTGPRRRRSISSSSSGAAEGRLLSLSPRSPVTRKTRATMVATTVVPESVLEGSSSSVVVVESEPGSVQRRRSGYRGRRVNSSSASNVTPPLPLLTGTANASVTVAGGSGAGTGGGGAGNGSSGVVSGASSNASGVATPTRGSFHVSPGPSQTLSSNLISLHDIHGELAQLYLTPISSSLSAVPQPVAFSALHFSGRSASWRSSAAAAAAAAAASGVGQAAAAAAAGGHTPAATTAPLSRPRALSGSGSRTSSERRRNRQSGTSSSATLDEEGTEAVAGTPASKAVESANASGSAQRRQSMVQGAGRTRHSLGRTRPSFSTAEGVRDGEAAAMQPTSVAPSVSSTQFTLVNTQSMPPTPAPQPALPALTVPLPMPALDAAATRRPPTPPPLERDAGAGGGGSGPPRRGSWMLSSSWAPPGSPNSVAGRSPSVVSVSRPSSRTSFAGRAVGLAFAEKEGGDAAEQLDYSFAGSTSMSMASAGRSFADELPPPPPAPPAQLTLGRSAAAQPQSVLSISSPFPSRVLVPSSRTMQQQQQRDSTGAGRPPPPPPPPPPPTSTFSDDNSRASGDGGDGSGLGASVTSVRRGSLTSMSSWVPGGRIEPLMLSAPVLPPPTPPRPSIPSSISNKSSLSQGTQSTTTTGTTSSRLSSIESLRSPAPLHIAAAASQSASGGPSEGESSGSDGRSAARDTLPPASLAAARSSMVSMLAAAEGSPAPLTPVVNATSSAVERSGAESLPTPAPPPVVPPAAMEDKKSPVPVPPPPPLPEPPARRLRASAGDKGKAMPESPLAQEPSLLSRSETAATARLSKSLALSSRQQELAQSFRERIQVGVRASRRRQTTQQTDASSTSSASPPTSSRRRTSGGGSGTSGSDGAPSRSSRASSGSGRRRTGSLRRSKGASSTLTSASAGAGGAGVLTLAGAAVTAIAYARLLRPVLALRAQRLMSEVTEPAAAYRIQCWWRRRTQLRRVREKTALQLLVPWLRFRLHRLRGAKEASARLLQRVFRGEAVRSLHRWLYGQRRLNAALGVIRRYVQRWEAQNHLRGLQLQRDERTIVVGTCVQGCLQLFRAEQLEWAAIVKSGAEVLQCRPSVSMRDWVTGVAALTGVVHQPGSPHGLRTVGPAVMAAAAAQAARTSTARLRDRLRDMAQLGQRPTHAAPAHTATELLDNAQGAAVAPVALITGVDASAKRSHGMRSPPEMRSSSGSSGGFWDDGSISLSAAPPPRSPLRPPAIAPHACSGHRGRGAAAAVASRVEEDEDEDDAKAMDLFKRAVPAPVATTDEDVVLAFLELLRHIEATERVELERHLLAEHQAVLRRPLLLSKAVLYANEMLVPPLFAPLLLQMPSDAALDQAARLFEAERVARGAIIDMYVSMPLLYLRRPMLNPAAEARHSDIVRLLDGVADPWGDAERNERRFYRESAAYRHLTSRNSSLSKLESSTAFFTPHPSSLPTPPPEDADSVFNSRSTNALSVPVIPSMGDRAVSPGSGGDFTASSGLRVRVNLTPHVYYPASARMSNASGAQGQPSYASFGASPTPSAGWFGTGGGTGSESVGSGGSGAGGGGLVEDDPHAASFLTNCHNGVGDAQSKTAIPSPHRRPRGPPLPLLRKLMPSAGRSRQGTSRPSLQPASSTLSRPIPAPPQLPTASASGRVTSSAEPSAPRAQFLGSFSQTTPTRGSATRKTLPGLMMNPRSSSAFTAAGAQSPSISPMSKHRSSVESSDPSDATTVGYGTVLRQQQPQQFGVSAVTGSTAGLIPEGRVFSSPRVAARLSSLAPAQPTDGVLHHASFMESSGLSMLNTAATPTANSGVLTSTYIPELAVRRGTAGPPPPLAPASMRLPATSPSHAAGRGQQQHQNRERHAPLSSLPLSPAAVECHASKNAAGVVALLTMPAAIAFSPLGAAGFPATGARVPNAVEGGLASTLPAVDVRSASAGSARKPSSDLSRFSTRDSLFTRSELRDGGAVADAGSRGDAQRGERHARAAASRTQGSSSNSNFADGAEEALRKPSLRRERVLEKRPARASHDVVDFPPSPTVSSSSADDSVVVEPELGGVVHGGAPRSMQPHRPPTPPPRRCYYVSPPLSPAKVALQDVVQWAKGDSAADRVGSATVSVQHTADGAAAETSSFSASARRKPSSTPASRGGRGAGRFLSPVTKALAAPSIPAAATLD